MNTDLKKNLKFIGITVLILLYPSYMLFKYAYSDYLNDRALNIVYGAHQGVNDVEAKEKAIELLEKAKSYRRKHYIYFYNQAKLYLELQNFAKAETTLGDLIRIRPDDIKGYLYYGVALELNHKPDSARQLYLEYRNRVDREFQDTKPENKNPEQYRTYRLTLDLLLRDETSFNKDLQYLQIEDPGFIVADNLNELRTGDRSDFLLQMLGVSGTVSTSGK
ncbi:tetratricopeptide repeat protein [Saccharicrinis sp. FJH54]|uniref:tetratricopeptide repeat protein n=1 Tax=Saccharicrinis sp. FJH54 TaxID=3344665 RepID=UPI0035D4B9B3